MERLMFIQTSSICPVVFRFSAFQASHFQTMCPLFSREPRSYHIPSTCCIPRLTSVIPTQQQNPVKIGFPPVFTNFTIFVFRPMAAIAMTMRNLLNVFSGSVTVAGSENTVVTTEARTKNSTKNGKHCFRLKEDPAVCFSFLPL